MAFDILRPALPVQSESCRTVLCAIVLSVFTLLLADLQPAMARIGRFAFELPVYRDVPHEELAKQVETFVVQEVSNKFRRNPQFSIVEIIVTVNRNGDVMPLLTTQVSREQWRQSVSMKSLMRYHSAYADFQRPTLRSLPSLIAVARRSVVNWQGTASRTEISLDRGKLSPRVAQQQLSDLD